MKADLSHLHALERRWVAHLGDCDVCHYTITRCSVEHITRNLCSVGRNIRDEMACAVEAHLDTEHLTAKEATCDTQMQR